MVVSSKLQEPDFTPPLSVAHFIAVLRGYASTIALSLLALGIGYCICAMAYYLLTPSEIVTKQAFRLEFPGAVDGTYSNGTRFSARDIVSTPVLLRVYKDDALERFLTFHDFSAAVFALESSTAYERLLSAYQTQLSDTRLLPTDRERIQKELDQRTRALPKNEYSINLLRSGSARHLPESLARKVLSDVLRTWAEQAVTEHRVLDYEVSIVSPEAFLHGLERSGDAIVTTQIFRSKVTRVISDIDALLVIPGAELVRTKQDRASLSEIRMRLEEMLRFRVEPLIAVVRSAGDHTQPGTLRFLEAQLAYDQLVLKQKQQYRDAVRDALTAYSMDQNGSTARDTAIAGAGRTTVTLPGTSGTVMPQLNESFIDRLVALTTQASDAQYRQRLVQDFRHAQEATVPVQIAVLYDVQILDDIRRGHSGPASPESTQSVQQELTDLAGEGRSLVADVNEIYKALSEHLNPSRTLYSLTTPAVTTTERSQDLSKLLVTGTLLLLISLPVVLIACLVHARVREERWMKDLQSNDAQVPASLATAKSSEEL